MTKSYILLKDEFQNLISANTIFFDFITKDKCDGILFCDLQNPEHYWLSESLLKTLKNDYSHQNWMSGLTETSKNQVLHLLQQSESEFKTELNFQSVTGNPIVLAAEALIINKNEGVHQRLLIRFKNSVKEVKQLKKIKKLKRLNQIFQETNQTARVGGWEADLINQTLTWTKVTKEIHEVDEKFVPNIETALEFYKEGWSRDLVIKLFDKAVENGTPFDEEFKIITARGNEKWVRSFGKPEFVDDKCVRVYGAFQDIDEKKKQELEYIETKEKFEIIFNNSSLGIVLVNKEGRILMINPASLKIFGFEKTDPETLYNFTYKDLIHPDDLEMAANYRKRLLAGELKNYSIVCRFYRNDGEIIWCRTNTSIAYLNNSDDFLVTTQVEDITERKKLEELASENALRFKSAFEYSPNGMALVGLEGNWLMVNQSLCDMLGYTKDEFMHLTFQQMTHKDDLDIDLRLLRQVIDGRINTYSIEKRYLHKQGNIVYGLLNVSLIKDESGNSLYFVSQINNITKRVLAKQELEKSLNEHKSLLNATTEVSIIETDVNGIIKKFNKGAEKLLGYKAEDVIGAMNVSDIHDPEEIARRGKVLSEFYNEDIQGFKAFVYKADIGEFNSIESTFIRQDGTEFPVQLVITSIRNPKNEITGYVGIAIDISQLKKMETSLRKEKLKAEEANKSKSEFLANMSHEIRTPLNGVIGFTDLLMKTSLSETQGKYMEMVNSSAHSLLDLINDILDFSKIEAGKLELNEEKTDIIELCSQTVDIIKHDAHTKGLELLLNILPDVKRFIFADPIRLRQILINLLGNAVKFTERGEIELKVENVPVESTEEEMMFTFSIRDTGIGIAPHNLKKIFNAFDQEDASTTRKYGGTGLGITISNRLLELMDSSLKVESKLNEGSTFSFNVKFKTEEGESYKNENTHDVKRVLIVDDNENNVTILKDMLAFGKIESISASNGIDALEILEKDRDFDFAIIDYNMPYLSGIELIGHIRNKVGLTKEDLPIMLLHSSIINNDIVQACKDLDVKFNITKPIRIDQLFDLISVVKKPVSEGKREEVTEIASDKFESSFNILVAEDNPVNQILAKTIIQKVLPNANIVLAEDGQRAVDLFNDSLFDFIFMDIQMPVMSGFDAAKKIRSLEKGRSIPIVALTARVLTGEKERCIEAGMNDYITKPIIFEKLKGIITEYLIDKS